MLYCITFYYTFSVIVIVSDLKVPSLQILHTEHYSETISFFSNYIPSLGKQTLACNWRGWYCQQTFGDCCYWRLLLAVHRPQGQWILAVRKCRLGEVSCQLLTHNLLWRGVVSGRRRRYSIAGLCGVQFVPQARRRCGVTCRCSGRCEALVLTAASRQWHVAAGSEGGEQ